MRCARKLEAVLFFDEADSLLSRRVAMGESCATSINQNRNAPYPVQLRSDTEECRAWAKHRFVN